MRIIKLAIISLMVFMLLALSISLLLPSTINISRSIEIFTSKENVLQNISDTDKWKYWIANKDSVPVCTNNIASNKLFSMGSTKAWIVNSNDNQIIANWQVNTGPIVSSEFKISEKEGTNNVILEWNFIQKVKWYPWEKFALIASEKGFGDFMEACLENLKRHCENETGEENL
jgi:hypothetical protein